jgi:hypothetical protein
VRYLDFLKDFKVFAFPLGALAAATTFFSYGIAQAQPKTGELIVLDSEVGEQLLFNSQARRDYISLLLEFVI